MLVESTRNDAVKRAKALANKKGRTEQGLHFIEGEKLVREAIVPELSSSRRSLRKGMTLWKRCLSGAEREFIPQSVM